MPIYNYRVQQKYEWCGQCRPDEFRVCHLQDFSQILDLFILVWIWCGISNAFILMKESVWHKRTTKTGKAKVRTMKEFRMNLAKQLIGTHRTQTEQVLGPLDPQNSCHFPRKSKKGRCRECAKHKKRTEPTVKCVACNVNLCINCFEPYHKSLWSQNGVKRSDRLQIIWINHERCEQWQGKCCVEFMYK